MRAYPLQNMTNENENDNSSNNENLNELLDINVEELDETALREKLTEIIPKYKETHQSNKQLFERAKSAEGGLKELREKLKTIEPAKEPEKVAPQAKTGELDAIESLLLEVKGIQHPDDVAHYEKWKSDTGRDGRQILNNAIFQKELAELKQKRELQDATPSGTRRGGVPVEGFDAALAKFQATGELPKDFALKSKVIDAATNIGNTSLPPWKR